MKQKLYLYQFCFFHITKNDISQRTPTVYNPESFPLFSTYFGMNIAVSNQ